MAIEVTTNAGSIAVHYGDASKLVSKNIVTTFRRIGPALLTYIAREKLSGQVLERRTSTLTRALFYQVFLSERDAVLRIGADGKKAAYAHIQEEGGTIRPVHAQHLAIPLDAARTAKGVARMGAREFISNPESLGFERAFVNRKGTAIMGARGGVAEPVYALKDSVTLPARPYVSTGVGDRRDWILEQLGAEATDGV